MVIFHIGMPRAGSTTLQRGLFSDTTIFHGFGVDESREPNRPWRDYGLGTPTTTPIQALDAFRMILQDRVEKSDGKRFVISDEEFLSRHTRLVDQEAFARRIAHIDEDPHVLIVIREQSAILISRYRQLKPWKAWATVGAGITQSVPKRDQPRQFGAMPRFDRWVAMGLASGPLTSFSNLDYDTIHRIYSAELGSDRVHVVLFEELKYDLPTFARRLGEAMNLDSHVISDRLAGKAYNVSGGRKSWNRVRSPFIDRSGRSLGWANVVRLLSHRRTGGGFAPRFTDDMLETLKERYGQENRRLAERLQLPLDLYGYLT